jgi:hypothetical protein
MKTLKFATVIVFLFFANTGFAQKQDEVKTVQKDSVAIAQGDTTEYELMVFDIGFENWLHTHSKPKWYYEKEYYRSQNNRYVSSWNSKVRSTMGRPPFEYEIDYDQKVDYGLELNWKLFWYFRYLEEKLGIKLK